MTTNIAIKGNTLLIGDLHTPFGIKGAIKFALKMYKKYNCTHVIFLGDIIDNHYSSYHETDSDGLSGGEELELAIKDVQKWHKAFPKARVCIGNHDRIIRRKAQTGDIPKAWIKDFVEVLGVQGWEFDTEFIINGVRYIHGEGGIARNRMKKDMISTVQGHLHTEFSIDYLVGANFRIFGMQVGCLIDKDSYAMAYAKHFPKPAIGLGVMTENGTLPILVPAELKNGAII